MRTREENMAIAALVCAICGIVLCCGPASIVAIILGAMVVKKVSKLINITSLQLKLHKGCYPLNFIESEE